VVLYHRYAGHASFRTLLRDEVGAFLHAEDAQAYVDMLRTVTRMGEFRQVAFVSHHPAAIDMADAQILVKNGAISIR
jgi:DNA repair exonuclease SbcCD ATPase subunit